jgi:hypothetical protein
MLIYMRMQPVYLLSTQQTDPVKIAMVTRTHTYTPKLCSEAHADVPTRLSCNV